MSRNPLILLAEDNAGDAELTRIGLERTGLSPRIEHVDNGRHCIELLHQMRERGEEYPDVILLDLNMPVIDGRGVLEELAKHEELRRIPVVVLSTSDAPSDLELCYGLGANSYIRKAVDFREFAQQMRAFAMYWFDVNVCATRRLPR